jgi:hypothetical protein
MRHSQQMDFGIGGEDEGGKERSGMVFEVN